MLTELKLPPGIVQAGTPYESQGRWQDGNLIRWVNGRMRPVGGWEKITTTALTGTPTNMLGWKVVTSVDDYDWLAIGTESKLYAYADGTYNDVTPSGLTAGNASSSLGVGFGSASYGGQDWGDARTGSNLKLKSNNWSLDTFGNYLIACSYADGRIFVFNPTGTPITAATVIANAPTDNSGVLVTDERFVVALAAGGNPRKVQWSDREDYSTWAPASTNLAGSIELQTHAEIEAGFKVGNDVLIITREDAHRMQYVGAPLVYGVDRIGDRCGIVAHRAGVSADNRAFWMGRDQFYVYDGYVKPLPCDVHDYIFDDINYFQAEQITAGHNSQFNEVWWFFPSSSSTHPDKYVAYNYQEGYWTVGQMPRTAWLDQGVFAYPIAAKSDGHLYYHENGWTDSGSDRKNDIYCLSGPVQLAGGDKTMAVNQLVIDEQADSSGTVGVTFQLRPNQNAAATTVGPFTVGSNGYTDCRFTARQVEIKVQAQKDGRFDYGILRADLRPGGRR
jgi:hypothetical protein